MVAAKKKASVGKKKPAPETPSSEYGARINKLGREREAIRKLEATLKEKKDAFDEACLELRKDLVSAKLEGALGSKFTAGVGERETASIDDYNRFSKYVFRTKSLDLLQSRPSITAIRERMADGKTVPGISIYKKPVLNLRVRKK
jgi:hypothetical protein